MSDYKTQLNAKSLRVIAENALKVPPEIIDCYVNEIIEKATKTAERGLRCLTFDIINKKVYLEQLPFLAKRINEIFRERGFTCSNVIHQNKAYDTGYVSFYITW